MGAPSKHKIHTETYQNYAINYKKHLDILGLNHQTTQTRYLYLKEFFSWLEYQYLFKIEEVTTQDISSYHEYLKVKISQRTNLPIKQKSRYDHMRNLQQFLGHLLDLGIIKSSPASHLKFTNPTEKIEQLKIKEKQLKDFQQEKSRERENQQAAKDNQTKDKDGNTMGQSCFIAGTKVTMADGTLKNIENVKVGDKVKGHKEENTVIKLDPTLLADRKLYSFNDNEHYFFTSEHPFMTEEGWKSIKPEKTKERDGVELYDQLKGELKVGDKLVTDNGPVEVKDIKSKEMNNPEMPLYNFNVSNDNSYIADDYVVHNKGCFLKGTLITMADGTTKPVEQVDLGDEVAVGGKVFAVGRFLNTELYDYKGIKVSGSHMVNEDGTWMRVRDTKHGKSLGDDQNTVYVFGSENRRILINDILFTDYFEIEDQEQLLKEEDKFFDNWKTFANNEDQKNVNTLNAN